MSDTLRIVLVIGLIIYFCVVYHLLKKKRLALKYTLLWILTGAILFTLVIVPGILTSITHFLGIELPVNGLFTIGIGLILMILLSLTVIVSGMSAKMRVLVQRIAILEDQIERLKK